MSDELTKTFSANPLELIHWVWQRDVASRLIDAGMDQRKAFTVALLLRRKLRYTSACWDWHGPTTASGYGIAFDWLVHHIVAHFLKGPVQGDVVLQVCGQRQCCNPDHLLYFSEVPT